MFEVVVVSGPFLGSGLCFSLCVMFGSAVLVVTVRG